MANLRTRSQRVPFHARQIARLLAVSLVQSGWLLKHEADEAMSLDNLPALSFYVADPTAPNGTRSFLVTVEEIPS